jgi:hypothetical protein
MRENGTIQQEIWALKYVKLGQTNEKFNKSEGKIFIQNSCIIK